jgi:hypothetical protein
MKLPAGSHEAVSQGFERRLLFHVLRFGPPRPARRRLPHRFPDYSRRPPDRLREWSDLANARIIRAAARARFDAIASPRARPFPGPACHNPAP